MQFLFFDVEDLLRGLWASLCQLIYRLVAWLYELFMNVARVEILTTEDIQPIYQRVTMVLTIIMVFYVTFEAVKYVVQPDSFTDKEKGGGKLTLKMVLVVILIAFVPTIFTWAYKFQNVIFDNQVFSKIILGTPGVNTDEFGRVFSSNLLGMFYRPNEEVWGKEELENEENCEDLPCTFVVKTNLSTLATEGELPLMSIGLTDGDETDSIEEGEVFHYYIHFDGLFAVGVGIFVCYMLVLYCIDAGVRVAQLTFLQIIAPIPIIGYLSPKKDGIFQKWLQQCITTYLDLFLRLAIIYFGLLICQILTNSFSSETLFNNLPAGLSGTMKTFIYIVLILGILMFLHKAPKLLQELFPQRGAASGNFGLKAGDRVAPLAARGIGAAFGATRAVGGAIGRGVKAGIRNHQNGRSIFTKRGREQLRQDRLNKKEAKDEYKKAKKDYRTARKAHNANKNLEDHTTETKMIQERDRLNEQRNKLAKMKNEGYRSITANAAWGAVSGAWNGASEGIKATKLEDVRKNVQAGYKRDADKINAYEQHLNAGGAGGITGAIDRGITKMGETVGIPSRAAQIDQELKRNETRISVEKQRAGVEARTKKSADSAVDANISKIEDGKLEGQVDVSDASNLATDLGLGSDQLVDTDDAGNTTGKKLTAIRQAIVSDVEAKEQKAKALEEKAATDSSFEPAAKTAREEATAARTTLKNKTKKLAEYENTRILRAIKAKKENPLAPDVSDPNQGFEQGAVTAIKQAIQDIKEANQDPDTRARVKKYIKNYHGDDPDLIKAFENPDNIDKYDTIDKLGKILGSISKTRESDVEALESSNARLSNGEYKKEVTANTEYGGNSGKK